MGDEGLPNQDTKPNIHEREKKKLIDLITLKKKNFCTQL